MCKQKTQFCEDHTMQPQESLVQRRHLPEPEFHAVSLNKADTSQPQQVNPVIQSNTISRPLTEIWIGDYRTFDTLDPFRVNTLDYADLKGLILRGLMAWNPITRQWVPDTASRVTASRAKMSSHDRYTLTFELDATRRFHDGSPVTAADVAFSYAQMRQNLTWQALLEISEMDLQVLSSTRVRLSMSRFDAFLLDHYPSLLTVPIVPQAHYRKDPQRFGQHPIGSGPFSLTAFDNERITLDAFAGYGHGVPRIRRISVLRTSTNRLLSLVNTSQIQAVILPDDVTLHAQIKSWPHWHIGSPMAEHAGLLMAQQDALCKRALNVPDIAWNAHQWHWCPA